MEALYQTELHPRGLAEYQRVCSVWTGSPTRLTGTLAAHERSEGARRRGSSVPLQRAPRERDRAAMAGSLGRGAHVLDAEPHRPIGGRLRARRRPIEALRARHVPVPEW